VIQPWGFKLPYIPNTKRVFIWHGKEGSRINYIHENDLALDNWIPIGMAEELASNLPHAKFVKVDDKGHMLLFSHWRVILTELFNIK
jgi:pimeloyl-ACP methyl ester carboxylesterase